MPVIEHAIHESVIQPTGAKYGCFNRDWSKPGYFADTKIYRPGGTFFQSQWFIEHKMSRECRFDLSLKDALCAGCCHQGNGERYDAEIRAKGK